ncbi:unnamed protein product [Pleuronectes platessa]|uniref:Uncharacterized protein n=1 Tax=Pleuronectes platessa TaxID=8262 RepID=A0A9N7VF54_PLEPL|nr:unnamed protein product [Pleuronectes platessa]
MAMYRSTAMTHSVSMLAVTHRTSTEVQNSQNVSLSCQSPVTTIVAPRGHHKDPHDELRCTRYGVDYQQVSHHYGQYDDDQYDEAPRSCRIMPVEVLHVSKDVIVCGSSSGRDNSNNKNRMIPNEMYPNCP